MQQDEAYPLSAAEVNIQAPAADPARTHPMANLLPRLIPREYEDLKEDIRRHGLHAPIVVTVDGLVLDGRHREQACRELGIACPRVTVPDSRPESLIAVVASMNIHRRHLTPEQKAAWFERVLLECPTAAAAIIDVEQVKAAAEAARNGNLKRGEITADFPDDADAPTFRPADVGGEGKAER
jgi:ParB-like nuclease domain